MTVSGSRSEPPALLWLRWGMWALLVMVLAGLTAVWWNSAPTAPRATTSSQLPVYSQVPDFEFVSSTGAGIRSRDLDGPWVADFIFTRCAVTCPRMTSKMAALGDKLPPGVRRVSITVDPAHDTPQVLADYARSYGADRQDWLFLTGPEEELRRLIVEKFLLGVSDRAPDEPGYEDEPITHSTRFVLVDGSGGVRGYYDAFDAESVATLLTDAARLVR